MNEAPKHHLNKHLDNIPDGATYGRMQASQLSSGLFKPASWSGTNIGKQTTGVQLGTGSVGSGTGWQILATLGINIPGGTGSVAINLSCGVAGVSGGAINITNDVNGHNVGFSISAGAGPGTPQAAGVATVGGGSVVVTLNSPTTGTNLTLSIYLFTTGGTHVTASVTATQDTFTPFAPGAIG